MYLSVNVDRKLFIYTHSATEIVGFLLYSPFTCSFSDQHLIAFLIFDVTFPKLDHLIGLQGSRSAQEHPKNSFTLSHTLLINSSRLGVTSPTLYVASYLSPSLIFTLSHTMNSTSVSFQPRYIPPVCIVNFA